MSLRTPNRKPSGNFRRETTRIPASAVSVGSPCSGLTRRDFLAFATLLSPVLPAALPLEEIPRRTPSDIIQQHLESLGLEEIRSRLRHREALGSCIKFGRIAEVRGRRFVAGAEYPGTARLFLGPSHIRVTLLFEAEEYPIDAFIFDGKNVSAARFQTDRFGRLSSYLSTHSSILKTGLFAGVLSLDWPFLRADLSLKGIRSLGQKQFEGKDYDTLQYGTVEYDPIVGQVPRSPIRHSKTRLFFSGSTGHHIGTDYGFLAYDRTQLTEFFSEFRMFEGLTLPTFWQINLHSSSGKERWELRLRTIRQSGKAS